jgi:DNA-binding XRE family transcriptional regulator
MTALELREWRARLKLTRIEAESAIGVSRFAIQQYEDGKRWAGGLPEWLRKICAYYARYGGIE